MNSRLHSITVKGFKTIYELSDFQPGNLTVLVGPNGAGKSNFISLFRMVSWALSGPNKLPLFVGQRGGASKLLHEGPDQTREIESRLTIQTGFGNNEYRFRLFYAAGDSLIFADERYRFSRKELAGDAPWRELGAGHDSPKLMDEAHRDQTASVMLSLLKKIILYQFHNTTARARIRTKWNVDDSRWLKEDAGNIAPVLFRLREQERPYYQRIVDTIRLILPFFSDFELEPNHGNLMLAWYERNSDQLFTASQASDGMLRVIALITLLLQPERDLPTVMMLDEPELGLHPYAINVIGGLIRAASKSTQVLVATQSTTLVDCFGPSDIVIVEREDRRSTFRKLGAEDLNHWLEEYSLSELWEKNVFGGRPNGHQAAFHS
ncbi:MAG: AAA family ATPase [Bacteroidota bacterium]|nr:AAA family ATPase [Bacteroidota bacterium]MDE2957561.1 AAA family ATPase [Bacteroidota bacterium]